MRSARLLVTALLLLAVAGGAFGIVRWRSADTPPTSSRPLQSAAQLAAALPPTDRKIDTLQSRLSRKQDDPVLLAELGLAYLQKSRETGNPAWYGKADGVLMRSLTVAPENGEALNGLGILSLARHQFREALDYGQRAIRANPDRAGNYGIVGDALVELGRYEEAVGVIQQMVNLRPDLSSYSRVSYLRELYGKTDGAVAAMQQAVVAGGPTIENSAYVRVQLGNLYFNSGRLDAAEREYSATLEAAPNYGPAQAGLAYVRAARGDDASAADLLRQATEALPVPEYVIALGDLYSRMGRVDEARQQFDLVGVLNKLMVANGIDMNVETALFDADHGIDLPRALDRARAGYVSRPSIFGADVLAWTLYQSGNAAEAEPYAREALRLGTRDALKLFHAGMIAKAVGKEDEALAYLEQALTINPNFSLLYGETARRTLADLRAAAKARTPTGS